MYSVSFIGLSWFLSLLVFLGRQTLLCPHVTILGSLPTLNSKLRGICFRRRHEAKMCSHFPSVPTVRLMSIPWVIRSASPVVCSPFLYSLEDWYFCTALFLYGVRAQSCLTLCDPKDCSPPGSSVRGILRQEYWLPFPSPGHRPNPGIKPTPPASPASAGRFFTTAPSGRPLELRVCCSLMVSRTWQAYTLSWSSFKIPGLQHPCDTLGETYSLLDSHSI